MLELREVQNRQSPCYLCRHSRFVRRDGSVRDDPSLGIIECADCGLVTLTSLDHVGRDHYEQSGMHGASPPSVESWLRETDADDERRFQMLQPALVNRRVLDFGSGAGGFVSKAQSVVREIAAVEPERRVREHWKGEMTVLPSLDTAGSEYDIITAFHVIEHLPDPRATLAELGARLAKKGRLIIEVPSASDALLTLYDCAAFQNFTYWSQHLFLFNAPTMGELVRQSGLRLVSIQQYQRYPLSNHLHWLSHGSPGGHQRWAFLDNAILSNAYAASLASVGMCDTIIAYVERS
jgi:SAM-dependent methyltransferase